MYIEKIVIEMHLYLISALLHPKFCVDILVKIPAQFSRTCSVLLCNTCYKAQLISCNVELLYYIGLIGYVNIIYLFRLVISHN